ncbi:MAG: agmatinase [Thermoanaerobacteraceae bacterium]|uniref:Agmatinase n=1 Tax=Desulfofundulus thermobenzoicus TaxID=29376 RepID=A0A6N7IQM8_9FIRM|nr:agmatinase [Desulfofundulus thermobenzoicus]MBE3587764.1 agmatinase [Thermoanaerobacteraceae bacterium]MQL52344.1 agmatinase [Desulfofundulus thermobenzoicus]
MQGIWEKNGGFMGAIADYHRASLVLLGAPMDLTVSFRPGTRFGPAHIRQVSVGLEEYSPALERELSQCAFYDAGDLVLPPGGVKVSLSRVGSAVAGIVDDGKFPLLLGGEHLVTLPAVEAVARVHPDLVVVQLDAHADLRDEYLGERLSHATVMRRVAGVVGEGNLFQFGIRSGTREEFAYARACTHLFLEEICAPLQKVWGQLEGRPVYLTLDIDVLDPAYAPGTGAPEPGGCTPREVFQALYLLSRLQVVGMDLVEVSPVYDPTERTSLLAARIVREAILCFANRGH